MMIVGSVIKLEDCREEERCTRKRLWSSQGLDLQRLLYRTIFSAEGGEE